MLIAEQAGIRAMLTHPLDEEAARFYTRFGFIASPLRDQHLLLLLKDARRCGGLLIACEPEHSGAVQAAFHAQGHAEAVVIGEMIDSDGTVCVSLG